MKKGKHHHFGDESDSGDSIYSSEIPFGSSFLPGSTPITKVLVIATSAIWVAQMLLKQFKVVDLVDVLGLVPERVTGDFELWRLVTMLFLHVESPFHILFNMFTLWVFGREIERHLGHWRFLRFYLASGIVASLVYVAVHMIGQPFQYAIGASGAIMGVMVLFACLYPDMPVLAFLFVPMKAKYLVMLLVGLDLLYFTVLMPGDNGVAHSAHLGGAAFGFLYFRYAPRLRASIQRWEARRERHARDRDREMKQEVDELLSKISRDGLGALSSREKRFLKEASRHFRDRRG